MRRPTMLAVVFLVAAAGYARAGQAAAEIVGPTAEIHRNAFKTWSLFLVCNPDWVTPQKSADLANLYWSFKRFGDAIGKDHLAVWFWTRTGRIDDPRLAENVNVARSADYCVALKLRPSAGPFLVITTAYPDLKAFPTERAVIELGGLAPAQISSRLNSITDDLVLEGKVDEARARLQPAAPPPSAADATRPAASTSFWIRLLESTRRSMIGLGCNVNVRIEGGPLSAELRGCSPP